MTDKSREADKAQRLTTVIDPLRPAVVVRRRVVETNIEEAAPRGFSMPESRRPGQLAGARPEETSAEDENGPPSSVNVARALASLRADELRRVEELVRADDEEFDDDEEDAAEDDAPEMSGERAIPDVHEAPTVEVAIVPTILIAKEISLAELAKRMGLDATELAATLVARGFYSLTPKTNLERETARTIATSFGWNVADAPEEEEKPKRTRVSRPPAAPKSKPAKKTAKKKTAR